MRKLIACTVTSSFLLLTSLPGMAQRGLLGGHASTSSRTSISSMNQAGIQTDDPGTAKVRENSRTNVQTSSNAGVKEQGLARATASQSANTKADANRDFTVAPGMAKAESNVSSTTHAQGQANVKAGASTHASLAGKIKHRLHL